MSGRMYLSGKMSGEPDFNYPAFNAKAAELRAQGFEVVNPAENALPEGTPWEDHMRRDITLMMGCDSIYLLPGWNNSSGARLEHCIARNLGFTVIYGASA